jgi:uncharacterized tellurite resistance protein B-like protein
MKPYRDEVVTSAIQGLVDGGMTLEYAENFRQLLEQIYNCGYRESKRDSVDILMRLHERSGETHNYYQFAANQI